MTATHAENDEFADIPRVPIRLHRVARALAVGFAGAFGWGIRGIFGHELGAAIPGVLIAGTLALLSGHRIFRNRLWFVTALGGLAFSLGGAMSYGLLIGYTRQVQFASVLYGFLCLLLIGGLWGWIGGAFVGLGLARELDGIRGFVAVVSMAIAGTLSYLILVVVLHLHLSPPRSDMWAANLGAAIALGWLLRSWKVPAATAGALFGAFGFGVGFVAGNFLQTVGNLIGVTYDWWKVMEQTMGFTGGAALAWGIWFASDWGPRLERQPQMDDKVFPAWGRLLAWAVIFVWIPVGLALTRFSGDALTDLATRVHASNVSHFVKARQIQAWGWVALGIVSTFRWAVRPRQLAGWGAGAFLLVFAVEMFALAVLKTGYPLAGSPTTLVLVNLLFLALVAVALILAVRPDDRVFHLHPPALSGRFFLMLLGVAFALALAAAVVSVLLHSAPLPGAHLRW